MLTLHEKLQARLIPEPNTGCWLWLGAMTTEGYGHICFEGRKIPVHRASYEVYVGPIPNGLHIDHICRVRCCANPTHLRPLTSRENVLCGIGPSAHNHRKSSCIHGHPFTAENTHVNKVGTRICKTCRLAYLRAWKEKRGPEYVRAKRVAYDSRPDRKQRKRELDRFYYARDRASGDQDTVQRLRAKRLRYRARRRARLAAQLKEQP